MVEKQQYHRYCENESLSRENPRGLSCSLRTWLTRARQLQLHASAFVYKITNQLFLLFRGFNKQGYKCRRECLKEYLSTAFKIRFTLENASYVLICMCPECNAAIHKRCLEKIIGKCTGTATNSRDTMVSKVYNSPEISLSNII